MIKQHKESGLWVTDDGRVLMPAYRNHINPMLRKFHWTYGSKDKGGYMVVGFRGKIYKVHRLVAETFLDNPLNLPTVDHINRDKTANFVENLRYGSYKLQADNTDNVINRRDYGVRACDDPKAYQHAHYAKNAEHKLAACHEYSAKQRALGRRYRKCPDGKKHWITDEEYNKRYKETRYDARSLIRTQPF